MRFVPSQPSFRAQLIHLLVDNVDRRKYGRVARLNINATYPVGQRNGHRKATSTRALSNYIIPYASAPFSWSLFTFIRPLFMDRLNLFLSRMVHYSRDARQSRAGVVHTRRLQTLVLISPAKASSIERNLPRRRRTASTWRFSAPVAPSSRSSSCCTSGTGSSTPAQEIVIRYRAACVDFA